MNHKKIAKLMMAATLALTLSLNAVPMAFAEDPAAIEQAEAEARAAAEAKAKAEAEAAAKAEAEAKAKAEAEAAAKAEAKAKAEAEAAAQEPEQSEVVSEPANVEPELVPEQQEEVDPSGEPEQKDEPAQSSEPEQIDEVEIEDYPTPKGIAPTPPLPFEGSVLVRLKTKGELYFGEMVTLEAVVSGNGAAYQLHWQVDAHDGQGFRNIPGESGETYDFVITEENVAYDYRVLLTSAA